MILIPRNPYISCGDCLFWGFVFFLLQQSKNGRFLVHSNRELEEPFEQKEKKREMGQKSIIPESLHLI